METLLRRIPDLLRIDYASSEISLHALLARWRDLAGPRTPRPRHKWRPWRRCRRGIALRGRAAFLHMVVARTGASDGCSRHGD